jgi:hypothetical protein
MKLEDNLIQSFGRKTEETFEISGQGWKIVLKYVLRK